MVISLHQAWPSLFLSIPCILDELLALGSKGDNSNKTSPPKIVEKNWIFWMVSCHNPKFVAHWSSILEVPLNTSNKPPTKYFQKRMKVVMTKQKTIVMMETMIYKELNWEIKFGNIVDEEWGVKPSTKEELDNSMKWNEKGLTKYRGRMSLFSCFCFTISTINPTIHGIKIVSWKLWIRLLPAMQ